MVTTNHNAVSSIRKSSPTTPRPRTIQGAKIPPTLALALKKGFIPNGHVAGPVSMHGNTEILRGTATFEEGGMGWLECPVTITITYDWEKLRATCKTVQFTC